MTTPGGTSVLIRRAAIAVTLALAAAWVLTPTAYAARGSLPDGSWFGCSEEAGPGYIMVQGAPIWIHDATNMVTQQSWQTIGCVPDGADPANPPRWAPADGTFVQGDGKVNGVATHLPQVYEVVGGAPLQVSSWPAVGQSDAAPPQVDYFDNASLPPVGGPDPSTTGGASPLRLYGYFSSHVTNGYFRTLSGVYYRTESSGRVFVTAPPAAGAAQPPTVDQHSLDTCERMNCDPWGNVSATVVGNGQVEVNGWALDVSTQPVTVHIEAAGRTFDIPANQPSPDLAKTLGVAGNHSFDTVLSLPAGHYTLCTTFNGFAPGATSEPEGCQVLDVPGAKPGRVHRPKVKATSHGTALVRWKAPSGHGSAISAYLVHGAGEKKQVSGRTTHLRFKHLRPGTMFAVKVRAIGDGGTGKDSKKSKAVRIR